MVDPLHPGGEQGVELGEIRDAPVFDLDQELLADRGENPLDLPPAGRLSWLTVDQADPEHPAGSSQPPGDKNVPVVDVKALWYTSGGKAGPQRRFEAQGVLGMAPAVAGKKPGMVVDAGEQVALPVGHNGTVQGIPGPQVVGGQRFEATEDLRWPPVGGAVQAQHGEVALDGSGGR